MGRDRHGTDSNSTASNRSVLWKVNWPVFRHCPWNKSDFSMWIQPRIFVEISSWTANWQRSNNWTLEIFSPMNCRSLGKEKHQQWILLSILIPLLHVCRTIWSPFIVDWNVKNVISRRWHGIESSSLDNRFSFHTQRREWPMKRSISWYSNNWNACWGKTAISTRYPTTPWTVMIPWENDIHLHWNISMKTERNVRSVRGIGRETRKLCSRRRFSSLSFLVSVLVVRSNRMIRNSVWLAEASPSNGKHQHTIYVIYRVGNK